MKFILVNYKLVDDLEYTIGHLNIANIHMIDHALNGAYIAFNKDDGIFTEQTPEEIIQLIDNIEAT